MFNSSADFEVSKRGYRVAQVELSKEIKQNSRVWSNFYSFPQGYSVFSSRFDSTKEKSKELSWHLLPLSNKELLRTWLIKIKRTNTLVSKKSYLCSKHFEEDREYG